MSSGSMVSAVPMQFIPRNSGTNSASGTKRPRSSTSGSTASSRRTKSRASTASAASSGTQPFYPEQQHTGPTQHPPNQHVQYTPEEMITRSEHQLTNPQAGYTFDPNLQPHVNYPERPSLSHYPSYEARDHSAFEQTNGEQAADDNVTTDGRKKKGSASSIANDIELKKLFVENKGRPLQEVAAQVLANERGPRSEKTKQIFAMLWLNTVCKKSSNSVPRNRVFSHYATRCGTERVPPLNPASFGKLVRIIFPAIQTRRLGMRGESKYHYVDLSLVDDQQDATETNAGPSAADACRETERPLRHQSQLPADTAVFPSPDMAIDSTFRPSHGQYKVPECLYLHATSHNMQRTPSRPNMVNYSLKFPSKEDPSYRDDEAIILPSVHGCIPIGTDPDTAEALAALYRTHCISVIDAFRFCKERMLWHHFTSFHGTLTVPVQKLFAHPNMAAWIKECDWLMYQRMVQFVSPLALQVVPMRVIDTFRAISTKLIHHLSLTFQNHPPHVRDAKLGPATVFAGLLDRLLRVNATAHAAANMLTNDANRDQMWHDWVLYVKPLKVTESSLPGVGYQRTLRILATEMRHLLGPLRTSTYGGMDLIYTETLTEPSSSYSGHGHPEIDDSSTEGVLDRWTNFLQTLPSLFPHADARTLLHCAGAVGNAALRDITIAQALSFGSWWVTKTWVDEMLLWMAEKGGFMEHTSDTMQMRGRDEAAPEIELPPDDASDIFGDPRPRTAVSESADAPSRFGSVDINNGYDPDDSRGPCVAYQDNYLRDGSHPSLPTGGAAGARDTQGREVVTTNPDDSGIALETEQDELQKDHYSGFVAEGSNMASDPADVVVC
ncbi:MAG: hypothetical protein LQ349_000341 [Xanthoria aureola]|nr:MAG: hypothetical protein LQ349_000341 [Xanthoria aureola]